MRTKKDRQLRQQLTEIFPNTGERNYQMNYNTNKREKTSIGILAMALAVVIAFTIYAASTATAGKKWDVEYPMANGTISWQQTFYAGSWGDAE